MGRYVSTLGGSVSYYSICQCYLPLKQVFVLSHGAELEYIALNVDERLNLEGEDGGVWGVRGGVAGSQK